METYISDKKLKDAGIKRLEPTRGLQVKQRLVCLKHNEEFIGILSHVMSRKQDYILRCSSCVTQAIKNKDPLVGFNFFKPENEWALKLRLGVASRFPHHSYRSTRDGQLVLYCTKAKRRFLTSLGSEVRLNATQCPVCGPENERKRLENINLTNGKRYAEKNTNPLVEYTEKGKVCIAHGNRWRCRVCDPVVSIGDKKLSLAGMTPETATLKGYRAYLKIRREKRLSRHLSANHLKVVRGKIKVCEHKSVSEIEALRNIKVLACLKCERHIPAKVYFQTVHPKIKFTIFKPVSDQPSVTNYRVKVSGGKELLFNSLSGKLRNTDTDQPIARNHLTLRSMNVAKRLTKEDFKLRIVAKHPDIIPLAIKLDWSEGIPVRLKHTCGNTWETKINNVLKSKVGCPVCGWKQAKVNMGLENLSKAQDKLDKIAVKPGMFTAIGTVPSTNKAYKVFVVCRCNTCTSEFVHSSCKLRCPKCSISNRGGKSPISWEWLSNLERLLKIEIQGCNSKEVTVEVEGKRYRVDGFHRSTNTVFEFLGDYWHGNPDTHPAKGREIAYQKTIERLTQLHRKYSVIYVWEKAYNEDRRSFSGFMSHTGLPFIFPTQ
jgi:hypothetical protein